MALLSSLRWHIEGLGVVGERLVPSTVVSWLNKKNIFFIRKKCGTASRSATPRSSASRSHYPNYHWIQLKSESDSVCPRSLDPFHMQVTIQIGSRLHGHVAFNVHLLLLWTGKNFVWRSSFVNLNTDFSQNFNCFIKKYIQLLIVLLTL